MPNTSTKTSLIDDIFFNEYTGNLYEISSDEDPIFLGLFWEAVDLDLLSKRFLSLIENVQQHFANKKIIVFVNSYYKFSQLHTFFPRGDVEIFYIDYFLLLTYYRLVIAQESQCVTNWEPRHNKFLFLTGKPDKPQRIGLLHKFYTLGMLEFANWSLFVPRHLRLRCRKLLPDITDNDFDLFVKKCLRNPDNIKYIENHSIHYSGIPFATSLYSHCDFQIVSETDCNLPWITEKTWLSIINMRPFIVVGGNGTLKKLNAFGFKTFEQFLPVKNYDELDSIESKINAVSVNTVAWLQTIQKQQSEILEIVNYNFERFITIAKENIDILDSIITKYKLDCTFDDLIPLYDNFSNKKQKTI